MMTTVVNMFSQRIATRIRKNSLKRLKVIQKATLRLILKEIVIPISIFIHPGSIADQKLNAWKLVLALGQTRSGLFWSLV
jgi:hypothetical protein